MALTALSIRTCDKIDDIRAGKNRADKVAASFVGESFG